MNPFQITGSLAIIFGILVIGFPQIISILVGVFFIAVGLNILAYGGRLKRWFEQ